MSSDPDGLCLYVLCCLNPRCASDGLATRIMDTLYPRYVSCFSCSLIPAGSDVYHSVTMPGSLSRTYVFRVSYPCRTFCALAMVQPASHPHLSEIFSSWCFHVEHLDTPISSEPLVWSLSLPEGLVVCKLLSIPL